MIALNQQAVDAGAFAGVITTLVAAIYALTRVSRDIAHGVRLMAEIPERLDRLEEHQTAFGARLDEHLIAEEAAINSLAAEMRVLSERRAEPRS